MSAFAVVPKSTARCLAVRSWPGNEDDIENIFGHRVRKSEDPGFYDWVLLSESGYVADPVSRGDWLVLDPKNEIRRYSAEEFTAKFSIMESIFNLPDPTGKQDQE